MNHKICKRVRLLRFEILQIHLGKAQSGLFSAGLSREGPISFLKQKIEGVFGQGLVNYCKLVNNGSCCLDVPVFTVLLVLDNISSSIEEQRTAQEWLFSTPEWNSRASDLPQGSDAREVSPIAPIRESCCYRVAQMAAKKTDWPVLNVIERFAQSPLEFLCFLWSLFYMSMLNKSFHLECELL